MSGRLQIGQQLGDYRIVGFLGAGGMGAVYHGIHVKIDRPAAIKILTNVTGHSTFKERFFNEARVQSSLHHPNIATLYDFREAGDILYIVMEFVDGETFDALIERKHFAVEDALQAFESVCEAVSFIHKNNVVHRDIKPQNVKLAANGTVKLLDFGIAKDGASEGLTRIGGVIGTPDFLAPEQLMGQVATPLSDIWALGVLLYEMLTCSRPFKAQGPADAYRQIIAAKIIPPSKLNSAVPDDVSRLISRCLSVDPKMRYQSVDEIIVDLRRTLGRYQPQAEVRTGPRNSLGGIRNINEGSTGGVNPNSDIPDPGSRSGLPVFRIVAVLTSILFLLIVVGLGIWAVAGPSSANNNNLPATVNSSKQTIPKTSPSVIQKGPDVALQSRQTGASDRPRVTVEVIDGPTEVYREGKLLGTTPLAIEGNENEAVTLTLKRDGYEDQDENIEITTRRKVFTFSLKKKKSP